MPILRTDIELHLSGGTTNTDVDASVGGPMSNHTVSAVTLLHNLFDKVTGDESQDGDTNYRIIYVKNASLLNGELCRAYFSANYQGQIAMGLRETVNTNATALASESATPSPPVSFVSPSTRDTALDLGDLNADDFRALYLRRIVTAGSPAKNLAETDIEILIDSPE